jgi:hypothetical protein
VVTHEDRQYFAREHGFVYEPSVSDEKPRWGLTSTERCG